LQDTRPLATDDDFCAFAGISKQQSAQLRYLGTSPKFIRVTGRQIRYAWSEIEAWCDARTVSRSDQRGRGWADRPPSGAGRASTSESVIKPGARTKDA
jgi:predicted DNA-binding transcriptional regulator AlpA